jgi:hypothetical protein
LSPSSIIELYEVETFLSLHGFDETYRFSSTVNANYDLGSIKWNSFTYVPYPIEVEGFSYSGSGTLPRPTVRVANVEGYVTGILTQVNNFNYGNDLRGARFTRIRTLTRFIDHSNFAANVNPYGTPDPLSTMPNEVFYVDRKSLETRDCVEFELVPIFELSGVYAPKRQCLKRCRWIYRGDGCGYSGSKYFDENDKQVSSINDDVCGHRLSSCTARKDGFADKELPYGGFPGIGNYNFQK